MKPNLVLINAGTNDAGQNYQVDTVGKRMRGLIEYLCKCREIEKTLDRLSRTRADGK